MARTRASTKKVRRSRRRWRAFDSFEVASVFESYPKAIRLELMQLRQLIFDTAKVTAGVGELEEALRWGEPSYLTSTSKSGSIIRIDCKKPEEYAMYFHCQTDLVARFKSLYPREFLYNGNRGITFARKYRLPETELRDCISMALTYHLDKKRRRSPLG